MKIVRTEIKLELSLALYPIDYALSSVSENKTNATSHPNIGSFKTAIEEEWNKMSEEFILKPLISLHRRVDTIFEKKVAILSKFTVLCLLTSLFIFENQN